ncbi:MAG: radical SAM family heme chaperone HemW [Oscillospiraceae bacterium]|nr:radical SAM family heme chaperone HemW [Oscillospiraceae bacterium]MBQ4642567.1 radical SAM family heme chaperone HemW [Oscillospiraceae bacterium]
MPLFAKKHKIPLGIYIHVPFCRSKCQYCDFYSVTEKNDRLLDGYQDAVCTHIKEAGILAPDYVVDTIYFGGGTPSFFGADGMAAILTTIRKSFKVSSSAEISFEANPDSVSDRLLRRLRSEGFNRVSLGIQCDDDNILKKIGRPHNYAQAVSAVNRIRRFGFKNLSLDLMYGLPGQSLQDWEKTLANVLKLQPEHISCYGLKVEEGTPLYEYREFCNLADDDTQADMYLSAIEILGRHGYRQYEISNFCRKGNVSRHNLKYWNGDPYLGFGPNASSDFGGQRFTIIRDLEGYIRNMKTGKPVLQDVQTIAPRERAGEYLMMRLRTVSGIDPKEYEKKYLLPFAPLERNLIQCKERGLATKTFDGRWHLTPNGFLLSNSIISDLLLIQEQN